MVHVLYVHLCNLHVYMYTNLCVCGGGSNETGGSGNETGGSSSEIGECAPHSEVAL